MCIRDRVGNLTLNTGEDRLISAVISPSGDYAYFGTQTSPGIIVKVAQTTSFTSTGSTDAGRTGRTATTGGTGNTRTATSTSDSSPLTTGGKFCVTRME